MQQTKAGSDWFPIFKANLGLWFHWGVLEWIPIIVINWPLALCTQWKGQIPFSSIPGSLCSSQSPGWCPVSVSRKCWHQQALSALAGGKEGSCVSRAPRRDVPGSRGAVLSCRSPAGGSVSISHLLNSEFTAGTETLWLILTHLKLMSPLNCNSSQKLFAMDFAA